MDKSGLAETRTRRTVGRWWFGAILALGYAADVVEVSLPVDTPPKFTNQLDWLASLFPANLVLPIGLVLPLHGDRGPTPILLIIGLATLACWLACLRWAPRRIDLRPFLLILAAWLVISYALLFGFTMAAALLFDTIHGR